MLVRSMQVCLPAATADHYDRWAATGDRPGINYIDPGMQAQCQLLRAATSALAAPTACGQQLGRQSHGEVEAQTAPRCMVSWCAGWPLAGLQFCSRRPLKPLRHLLACCRGLQRGGAGGRAGSCTDGRRRPYGCVHTLASPEAAPVQVAARAGRRVAQGIGQQTCRHHAVGCTDNLSTQRSPLPAALLQGPQLALAAVVRHPQAGPCLH